MSLFLAIASSIKASSYEGTNVAVEPPTSGPTYSYTELERPTIPKKKRKAAESGSALADSDLWDTPGIMDDKNRLDEGRLASVDNRGNIRDDPAHGMTRNGSD